MKIEFPRIEFVVVIRRSFGWAKSCGLGILAAMIFSGCQPRVERADGADVVATTGMLADLARGLLGDEVTVQALMGEGVDPHGYRAGTDDVRALDGARVIFYNGLHLEGKMGEVLERLARKKTVVAVGEKVLETWKENPHGESGDPHLWMDVRAWMAAIEVVAAALVSTFPEKAEMIEGNKRTLRSNYQELHDYVVGAMASIPEEKRVLVTAHDAFGYMKAAYGLEVRGIQGISTESEAGLRDMEDLVKFLIKRKIPAVFVESSVSEKNVRALIEGCKAQGHDVRIGGELFSDAMGPAGTYQGTYEGMMDHNATVIAKALGGEVPAKGRKGKLER